MVNYDFFIFVCLLDVWVILVYRDIYLVDEVVKVFEEVRSLNESRMSVGVGNGGE